MKTLTCIVIGAGYAGIHAMKEIRKSLKNGEGSQPVRFILIEKNTYHFRKVLLFKPAVTDEEVRIPLAQLFPEGVELLQATVTSIATTEKKLQMLDATGNEQTISYDILVVSAGSVVRRPEASSGGLPLATLDDAQKIREVWRANLQLAATEANSLERKRLMTIAVAGAGISGIETAAELAYYVKEEARQLGLEPNAIDIRLYNAHDRLFINGPEKVSVKLEQFLTDSGVKVVNGSRVLQETDGCLRLPDGGELPVGLCVWTLGLMPNPILEQWGLPVTADGFVQIDTSYRVKGATGLYSIGDCAKVVDPRTGRSDGMTCKEAIPQASRLAKVITADLNGQPAPVHTGYMDTFSIGLGPEKGLTWVRKWGIDLMLTGKLGYRIKRFTWDLASTIK
ncbi:NAD(P)/FAD-dependent oxidoreductase [Paenibacillus harenae]|uniref:NAD(P)/FAD-dependent oxidoreductase n=1 Tax=Paenibacillus harenae TaxID=306543 RepID=UPI002792C973|nr:FAD-dependent oxidoreductase [Paenibacillus harenae]MDQ0058717.1 NADH dehydrogenase [Paenibacillus harenae]